jgi:outer membrane protein TolC
MKPHVLLFVCLLAGCSCIPAAVTPPNDAQPAAPSPIQQVAFHEDCPATFPALGAGLPTPPPASETAPFAAATELTVGALVQEVLARNPSLEQMVAAWEAAAARPAQVSSLDDPMFGGTAALAAIGQLGDGNRGYRLELAQKYPWPGKRALRGQSARAEASAAANDIDAMRLQLVEAAQIAFYDYYLVARALAVNRQNLELLRRFQANAEKRYQAGAGRVSQQDVFQAMVEIDRQRARQITLERMQKVAIARINTLLNLPPDAPLPPPPSAIAVGDSLPDAPLLRAEALARRPDLQALLNRLHAEEAALALAYKEFYPDLEPWAAYDPFWAENQLRPQIGLRMNLPVRTARRYAAVREAQAKIAERRAEIAKLTNQVNFEVEQAYAEVKESEQTERLYVQSLLPKAELNVKTADTAYGTGLIPFVSLIEAQRELIGLRDRYYEVVADYYRRRAVLERAVGGPLPSVRQ